MNLDLDLGFRRVSDTPLLNLDAVPWCDTEPRPRPSIIFPTVVNMGALFASARERDRPGAGAGMPDQFFLYYAPHHSQGMGLAFASHPEGPWAPYAHNPILHLDDVPGLRGHISSPELVYRPDQQEEPFWLYFHGAALPQGGGQQTCVASSADGIHWRVLSPEPVLTGTAAQTGDENTAAYVRVFQRDGWFYGLYKAEKAHGLARSRDGLAWEHWPGNPVIRPDPSASEYDRIRHTGILVEDGTLYIFYSTLTRPDLSREEIKLATLDVSDLDWNGWGGLRRHGVVFAPEQDWETTDLRDPFLFRWQDSLYLYYTGGGEQGIGLAKTAASALAAVPRTE
jgi:hypothetical protein